MANGRFCFSAPPPAQNSPELHFRFINSFISNHLCQNLCPHQNFLHSGALIHSTYDIRSIRHLSRSWQKKWMYVRQPNLFKSRSSHIVSMKFHRVHTYIFLDPFLFACDSLYNPKTQHFRSCYSVQVILCEVNCAIFLHKFT